MKDCYESVAGPQKAFPGLICVASRALKSLIGVYMGLEKLGLSIGALTYTAAPRYPALFPGLPLNPIDRA